MKRLFLLGVASLIFYLPGFSRTTSSIPAADTLQTYWLNEIVVSAEREDKQNIFPLQEISVSAIKPLETSDASQPLKLVPGLYLTLSSKNEKTFRLRGVEQRQISVFLDGIPISIPFNGLVDLSQFAGSNIEKIKIASGVSSVLYGTNNIGGSVNLITEEPTTVPRLKFRLEHNPDGYLLGSASYGRTLGRFMFLGAVNYNRSANFVLPNSSPVLPNENGGRRDHSSYEKKDAFFKVRFSLTPRHLIGFHLNWIDNWFDVPPNALTRRPRFWRFPQWQRFLYSINTSHVFNNLFLRTTWYYDNYQNTLKSYDDVSYTTQTRRYAFTSIYDDYSYGVTLFPETQLLDFGKSKGILAFKKDVHREKAPQSAFREYAIQTLTFGFEQALHLGQRWAVQLGADVNYLQPLKAENFTVRDPITLVNGQLAVKFALTTQWSLQVCSGQKSRFPTLKELYSEYLGRSIANPNLKPEHGFNNELRLQWHNGTTQFSLSLFYYRLRNLIVPVALEGNNRLTQMQNIGKARFYGSEFQFQKHWKRLELFTHYTFLQAENQSAQRTSDHLEYRPEHQLFVLTKVHLFPRWTLEGEVQAVARQFYQNYDNLNWEKLNDYAIFNGRLVFQPLSFARIYLRVNNLFDRFYYSEWGVPMPGRQIIFGLQGELQSFFK